MSIQTISTDAHNFDASWKSSKELFAAKNSPFLRRGCDLAGGVYVGTTKAGTQWVARSTRSMTLWQAFEQMKARFDGLAAAGKWSLFSDR